MSWPRRAIAEIAVINPRTPAHVSAQRDTTIDFVPMASLSATGRVKPSETRNIADVLKGYTYFANGDVVVAKITPCMENGKAAFVDNLPHGIGFGSTEFHVLRPSEGVSGEYLFWMVWSPMFRAAAGTNMTGSAGQKRVPAGFFERYQVPLPPLPVQKRIAAILDAADALRAKRRESIEQLDSLVRATFLEMFGDPVTNPKGWEKCPLDAACSHIIDCPHSTPSWTTGGVICLRTSNLGKGYWDWSDKRFVSDAEYMSRSRRLELQPGDIVLSREGTVGIAAIITPTMRACMGQRLVQVRANLKRIVPKYLLGVLLHALSPDRISQAMAGSTSKHLNVRDLRELKICVPPIDLQARFASVVVSIEQQKARLKAHLAELDTLFASLQSRAFNGELVA